MRPRFDGQPFHVSPGDPGGATSWAVIFSTFVAWRMQQGLPAPTLADFRMADPEELRDIRHALFWLPAAGDRLRTGPDLIVWEIAIGSGGGRAAQLLKRALGLPEDHPARTPAAWCAGSPPRIAPMWTAWLARAASAPAGIFASPQPKPRRWNGSKESPMHSSPAPAAAAPEVTLADSERQPCEVWTRVMGYHRPVASFNTGKQGEHAERVPFVVHTDAAPVADV